MHQFARLSLMLGLAGLLQACQLAAPGGSAVTANAITGDAIEVTALDAAPTGAPPPVAPAAAGAQTAPPPSAGDPAGTDPAPAPIPDGSAATATGQDGATEKAVEVVPEVVPEVAPEPKSAQQQACERKRGNWVRAVGELKACVYPTGDAGKRCTRESQCEGACLARSNTCAPVKPLFGCNEILQDDGARVTLCIE